MPGHRDWPTGGYSGRQDNGPPAS